MAAFFIARSGEDGEPAFENDWYNTTLIVDDETCGFGKDSFGFDIC
ncbi:MAG: hypothetical protein JXJ04_05415 [Spirochaetales bacterium]|nr:hypothetical protein [Spirochaetales bacterium]